MDVRNLYANEAFSDSDEEAPPQVALISSSSRYYSGSARFLPDGRTDLFIYTYPPEAESLFNTSVVGNVFIESTLRFKPSEYNFGPIFDNLTDVTIEFKLPLHDIFYKMLCFKWNNFDFDYDLNIYTHQGVAVWDFANTDYWPTILAYFAFQCENNGIPFFDHTRLIDTEGNDYGTIFA